MSGGHLVSDELANVKILHTAYAYELWTSYNISQGGASEIERYDISDLSVLWHFIGGTFRGL